jgi:hypothetical protein
MDLLVNDENIRIERYELGSWAPFLCNYLPEDRQMCW